ncbi:MAG: hypothetical protein IJA78_05470 [Clostridia bacterium]|nr:hypothetical protein [Clostridia bacterium]
MKAYKRYFLMRVVVSALFGVACGVLLLLMRPYAEEIFDVLLIAMGLLTAVINLPAFFLALRSIHRRGEWINLTVAILSILLGVALTLLKGDALIILLVLFAAVLPLARIVLVTAHARQLRRELPRIALGGAMLFFLLAELEEWVFLVGAIALFALSALYLVHGILTLIFRIPNEDGQDNE